MCSYGEYITMSMLKWIAMLLRNIVRLFSLINLMFIAANEMLLDITKRRW